MKKYFLSYSRGDQAFVGNALAVEEPDNGDGARR